MNPQLWSAFVSRTLLALILALPVGAAPAAAQFDAATVLGTVRDSSEGIVPGASSSPAASPTC